ncbi:MmcQ/YjbR family DNA-binding protein [Pseudooceanicola aestuarii]|uniref:MmcQ/YjbR family DNA-binding protein n=1 Tax=Pseudooceanicola aestuarii TaxID=2697319 RepID=UPI0013D555E7|nr:MmcQ/YjbR family DNA-binding protein [Pseudooceanicola aestuarii]
MSRDIVRQICAPLPGVELTHSFGPDHDVWKVGGKMFAIVGGRDDGVSVKTSDPEFAAMMIESGEARRAPYLHRSWVQLPWSAPQELIRARLEISYDIIRAALTKKVQATLPKR